MQKLGGGGGRIHFRMKGYEGTAFIFSNEMDCKEVEKEQVLICVK